MLPQNATEGRVSKSLTSFDGARRSKKALPRSKASDGNDPAVRFTPAGVISPKAVWGGLHPHCFSLDFATRTLNVNAAAAVICPTGEGPRDRSFLNFDCH